VITCLLTHDWVAYAWKEERGSAALKSLHGGEIPMVPVRCEHLLGSADNGYLIRAVATVSPVEQPIDGLNLLTSGVFV
jgi:hypothetical protein